MLILNGEIDPSLGPRRIKVKRESTEELELDLSRKEELGGPHAESTFEPVAES